MKIDKEHLDAVEYMKRFKASGKKVDETDYEHLEKEILADPIAFEAFKRNRSNRKDTEK